MRQVSPRGHHRSSCRPTRHDCEGLERVPRKQDQGCTETWVVTHAASHADSKVSTQGGDAMRRLNRMAQILPEQEQERQEVHDKIDAELHTVGLRHFGAAIAQRMELIEVLAARFNNDSRMIRRLCFESHDPLAEIFNNDSRRIRRLCLEVLDRIASILEPELQSKLNADSRRDMSIAAFLH